MTDVSLRGDPILLSKRRLTLGDAEALARFYERLSPEAVHVFDPFGGADRETIAEHMEGVAQGRHTACVVVDEGGAVRGHAFILDVGAAAPVFGIGLHDEAQGLGWGRRMMADIIAEADRMGVPLVTLTVCKSNYRARALYRSFGFRELRDHHGREEHDSLYCERRLYPAIRRGAAGDG